MFTSGPDPLNVELMSNVVIIFDLITIFSKIFQNNFKFYFLLLQIFTNTGIKFVLNNKDLFPCFLIVFFFKFLGSDFNELANRNAHEKNVHQFDHRTMKS